MSEQAALKQIQMKLDEMDLKLNAILVKEEPPTKQELKAMKRGHIEIKEGKLVSWESVKKELK